MNQTNESEKLVYTQSLTDMVILIAIILIMFAIIYFQLGDPYAKMATLGSFAFVIFLIVVIYSFFAIRRFELYPDKIVVKFPGYPLKTIMRSEIQNIKIELQPGFILGNRGKDPKMVFRFYLKSPLNILWYSNSFSINNYLYGGTATDDETRKLVDFFRKHYSEILIDLSNF